MAWTLDPDRCFSPVPSVRARARELYEGVRGLPLVSPHGHVPPELLADESARFSDPASLFIVPDHYVFRMLYSQGVPLESLGVPTLDGTPVEKDPRQIWRTFCAHFHLFDGTPTGLWLKSELIELFGLDVRPSPETADAIGVSVARYRYGHTIAGGMLAGVGGAFYSLSIVPIWVDGMTKGAGWIAIALVIFGFWRPGLTLAGAYAFGALQSLGVTLKARGVSISGDLLDAVPFLATIVVLVLISTRWSHRRIGAPAALGVPYEREAR